MNEAEINQNFDFVLHMLELVLAGGIFAFTWAIARQVKKAHDAENQAPEVD